MPAAKLCIRLRGFNPDLCSVEPIDTATAKAFVLEHHYLGIPAAASVRVISSQHPSRVCSGWCRCVCGAGVERVRNCVPGVDAVQRKYRVVARVGGPRQPVRQVTGCIPRARFRSRTPSRGLLHAALSSCASTSIRGCRFLIRCPATTAPSSSPAVTSASSIRRLGRFMPAGHTSNVAVT